MIRVDPFKAEDMALMNVQPSQQLPEFADPLDLGRMLGTGGNCFTIRNDDHSILFCGGSQKVHDQYENIWAVFADGLRRQEKLAIAKRAVRWLSLSNARRIEAQIRIDDTPAIRFAFWLGMEREGLKRAAAIDGCDMLVFVKIRDEENGS